MPCAHPYIFLGYPSGQKAYKLLNLVTHKIHISRDVKFFDNLYPLHSIQLKSIHSSFTPTSYIPIVSQFDHFTPAPEFTDVSNDNSNNSSL